jgi:hypothetical protein
MTKLVVLNDNFSCTPGTKTELVDAATCKCLGGTLYVTAKGATGLAETRDSKVVVLVDGGKAVQQHEKATIFGTGVQAILEHLPKPKPAPAETGASRSSGCSSNADFNKQVKQQPHRF